MRVISCEYDVVKVLASEMLNVEISRYLFYKGKVINWSNPIMSSLRNAMLVSSQYLDIDMFIKYSIPITEVNIEKEYEYAPLYPIYRDGKDDNTVSVHSNRFSNEVSSIHSKNYAINVPLMYNLYKLIKGVVMELRSYPVFKIKGLFDTIKGEIYNAHVTNSTIVHNYNQNTITYEKAIRVINTVYSDINVSSHSVEEDKHLIATSLHHIEGNTISYGWYFITSIDDHHTTNSMVNIYIDYLNFYKGARFTESLKSVSNIVLLKCNIDFLIPSLYSGHYIDNIELLNNDYAKDGVLCSGGIDGYTMCYGKCKSRIMNIGVVNTFKKISFCISCYYNLFQESDEKKLNATHMKLFYFDRRLDEYANTHFDSCSNKSRDLYSKISYLLLATLLDRDLNIEYTKKKGTIIKVKITITDDYDYIILFNNVRDLADIDYTEKTRLVYVNRYFNRYSHDDNDLDCNFQKI